MSTFSAADIREGDVLMVSDPAIPGMEPLRMVAKIERDGAIILTRKRSSVNLPAVEWRVNDGLSSHWAVFEAERSRRWVSFWQGVLWKWGA